MIGRYLALALARPGESFPVEKLVELYRDRDGKLDKLVQELSARADRRGPERHAALLALASVYRHDGEYERAKATYDTAIAETPADPLGRIALGRLLESKGDKAGARAALEAALPGVTVEADREQLLRSLVGLSLDLDDYPAAKRYHEEVVKRAKGSFFARAELGRELFTRGDFARAETEFREVVKAAQGDNRALAPALRDLGQALARENKHTEALDVLKRALVTAGGQSGLRREILDTMTEVYRATGGVAALVALLEKEHPDDFERLVLLAGLYEETGRVADALATYERALARKDDIATRLKVVQLLEVEGRLDEVIQQYDKLIHAAPHDPSLVFRLAETLIQRGDRAAALRHVQGLEARSASDEDTMAALVDFYERVGEKERAARLLDRLAASGRTDPRHIVELGDHYYRQGDTKRALEVWERIRVVVPDRAKALHAYGEVLLEHDMPDLALAALKQAVELAPHERKYQKALALAYERAAAGTTGTQRSDQYEAARRIWDAVLRDGGTDATALREARQHIVTIWAFDGRLAERTKPLERRLAQAPPDLEAGRLLAEVYGRLRQPADAERVLRAVVASAPGDQEAYLALERTLVAQRKLGAAIAVLSDLVKLDGRRARDYYQRMAGYAAELYRDDDAIRFASKAVELNPDDAEGHRKLGEMYRRRQDVPNAVLELRRALAKNDRLFPVYFDLAELLLTRGEVDEADRLLRHVVRASPDDDLVARAARLSMQVNLGRGSLESLERELLPAALGNPMRPVYRRLLVEVYDNLAFPLVHETKSEDAARAKAAREALRRIGERAVKPLLDALSDDRKAQQHTAIELLSRISNASAAPALLAFATGKADGDLRTRAMVAACALDDIGVLPRLKAVIAPSGNVRVDETDTVAIAAAWGVARLQNAKALPLLVDMLSSDAPSVRALAAIGIGLQKAHAQTARLAEMAGSAEQEPVARAAAAFALGALGGDAAQNTLLRLADAPNPLIRGTAVIGLSRLGSPEARRVVAAALVTSDPALRDAAHAAALVLASHEFRTQGDMLAVPEGRVDVRDVLADLKPRGYSADDEARAVVALEHDLGDAAATAAQTGPEGARAVADALLARGGRPAMAPLTDTLDKATAENRVAAEKAAEGISKALVGPFMALARHPSAEVRTRAIRVLSLRSEPEARAAVVAALDDPDATVQRAALALLSTAEDGASIAAVTRLAESAPEWPVRARATEALGAAIGGPQGTTALPILGKIAERDPIAFVREAAVRALGTTTDARARAVLSSVAARDPEAKLRTLAKSLIKDGR
jgi:tetratricopeptide (TPR) repeat protein/HEAT repeat protein